MNKKITCSALAALMIAGTTSFTALAEINVGTAVIGNKAYDLNYLAAKATEAEQKEVLNAIVAGENIYVKDFTGKWIDNATGETVKASVIPAVTYKDAEGVESKHTAGDDSEEVGTSVKSVEALSMKQFKMVFVNPVNDEDVEDEITDVSNYTLENEDEDEIDSAFEKIEIDDSKEFAIMTLKDEAIDDDDDDKVQNQKDYTLTIDEDVFGEEVVKTFEVKDLELPEVVSAEIVGKNTIKVIFSEPVKSSDKLVNQLKEECFEINDDDLSIDEINLLDNHNEANIILSTDLEDGDDVKVKVRSKFEDYAGYSIKATTLPLKVQQNKEELEVVGFKDTSDSEVTLIFNKDIKFGEDNSSDSDYEVAEDDDFLENFYHTNGKTTAKTAKIDGNELILTFDAEDDALPDGTAYVHVDAEALQDLWDKENNDLMIAVTVNADKEKPEIKKVEQGDSDDEIVVKFTEEVKDNGNGSGERKNNYTLYDKDGDEIKIDSIKLNSDKDEATITLRDDLDGGEEYKLEVEDIEDVVGNKISKDTIKFKSEAKSSVAAGDIDVDIYSKGEKEQKLVVDFDGEEMEIGKGKYAIDNIENYTVQVYNKDTKKVVKEYNLDDYYKAKFKLVDDNNGVELDVPADKADDENQIDFSELHSNEIIQLVISRVKTVNGNMINNVAYAPIEAKVGSKIDVDEDPVATSPTTIKVEFKKEFDFKVKDIEIVLIDEDGNVVKNGTKNVTLDTSQTKKPKKGGTTNVTYTLQKKYDKNSDQNYELNFDGTYTYKGTDYKVALLVVDNDSENQYDSTFEIGDMWIVSDNIKPELAKFADEDGNTMADNKDSYEDREDYDDAVRVVAFTNDAASNTYKATIEMKFEEKIKTDTLDEDTFEFDDSDLVVTDLRVGEDSKTIYLDVDFSSDDPKAEDSAHDIFDGAIIEANSAIKDLAKDYSDGIKNAEYDRNQVKELKTELDEDYFAKPMPEFDEKVVDENHAPTVKTAIADQTAKVGAEFTVNVNSNFADEDGDTLTFTAASNNGNATVAVSNGTLTITPVAVGTSEITVTANDSKENVSDTFVVTVEKEAPVVTLTEVVNPADITAKKADITLPAKVTAKYSDNTTKELAVTWNKTVDQLVEGENTLTGTVEGTDKTATLKVTVEEETSGEKPDFIDESKSKVKALFGGIAAVNVYAEEGCTVTVSGVTLKYSAEKKVYSGNITGVNVGDKVTVTAEKDGKSSSEVLDVETL
jgi:Big-like domain-containing protein/putative Ig domain-containing protein